MKYFLLASLLLVSFIDSKAQSLYINKIIDTNLFELSNGARVKLYGLSIPSLNELNQKHAALAKEILEWEKQTIANKIFEVEFISGGEEISQIKLSKISNNIEIDLASWFLQRGYATLIEGSDDYNKMLDYEKEAQKNKNGLWKEISMQYAGDKIISKEKAIELNKRYEKPYLYMLGISAASFVLAWDYITQASDIQDQIDFYKALNKTLKATYSTTTLEKSKSRKTIVGVVCLAAGVASTIFAFQDVEIRTDFQSISLSVGL